MKNRIIKQLTKNPVIFLLLLLICGSVIFMAFQSLFGTSKQRSLNTKKNASRIELSCTKGYIISADYGDKDTQGVAKRLTLTLLKDAQSQTLEMSVAPSGSGARFETSDKMYSFWEHQGEFTLAKQDETLSVCRTIEPDQTRPSLLTKTWKWEKTEYSDNTIIEPTQEGEFALTFKQDGKVMIQTDCNAMSSTYQLDGSKVTFGDIMSTKKYCEGSQENEFAQTLKEIVTFFFTEEGVLIMELKYDSGSMTFK